MIKQADATAKQKQVYHYNWRNRRHLLATLLHTHLLVRSTWTTNCLMLQRHLKLLHKGLGLLHDGSVNLWMVGSGVWEKWLCSLTKLPWSEIKVGNVWVVVFIIFNWKEKCFNYFYEVKRMSFHILVQRRNGMFFMIFWSEWEAIKCKVLDLTIFEGQM